MKQIILVLLLTGLCMISSCSRKSDTTRMAEMTDCLKIEFGVENDYSNADVIDNPEQIENIISAMQKMEHYVEGYESQWLFFDTMRATGRWGRTVTVDYTLGDATVYFRDGQSRELYTLLKEYGIIDPNAPVIIGHPDLTEQEKEAYERMKAGELEKSPSGFDDPELQKAIKEITGHTAKNVAALKNCRKIEFLPYVGFFDEPKAPFAEISDPEKISKILLAMQNLDPIATSGTYATTMKATDEDGQIQMASLFWDNAAKIVCFRDGQSKDVYRLFVECGIIDPSASVIIGHPDLKNDEATERLEN